MKFTKFLSLLLAAVMIMSMLAGCAKDEPVADDPVKEPVAEQSPESDAPAEDATAEPVKLKLMFRSFEEYVPGTIGDKWIDQIEEHCGVEIEWIRPAASAYEENLQLTLLDEELPDAMILPTTWVSSATFKDACEAGIFIDLADMLPNYPNLIEHTAAASFEALKVLDDDRIFGVPRSTVRRADGFSLNEQWLENLGIEYNEGDILTADEFYDILYAFTYDDPDGNGVNDTYGLMGYSNDDGTMVNNLQHIFGLGLGTEVYDINGEPVLLKYSKEHSNYKDYLAFANKCWEAGVIDPDAYSIDRVTAGDHMLFVGSESIYAANMNYIQTDIAPFTYKYVPAVVPEEGATPGYGEFANGIYWFWGISSQCEHPEKVLEVFDYMLSDDQWNNLNAGSVEGVAFEMTADGNYDFSKTEEFKANGLESTDPIKDIVRRSSDGEFYVDKTLPVEMRERIAKLINTSFDLYIEPLDDGFVPSIATDPVFIEYNAFMIQAEAQIITGEKPIEYWDEVLDGWYEAGGAQYVEEIMAYVNAK